LREYITEKKALSRDQKHRKQIRKKKNVWPRISPEPKHGEVDDDPKRRTKKRESARDGEESRKGPKEISTRKVRKSRWKTKLSQGDAQLHGQTP